MFIYGKGYKFIILLRLHGPKFSHVGMISDLLVKQNAQLFFFPQYITQYKIIHR